MVRQIATARGCQGGNVQVLRDVSAHVSLLHAVCNFRSMRGALVKAGVSEARSWHWGMLSLLYCEGTKVLQAAGVLRGVGHYKEHRLQFLVDLAGPEMRWLLRRLSESVPLNDGPPSAEAEQVAVHMGDSIRGVSIDAVLRYRLLSQAS